MNRKKNKKDDFIGFRTRTEKQKENFSDRSETLKSKGISKADIFEAGLLALESGNSEEQILRRKNKEINERNEHLKKALDNNKRIEAFNRQLKFKPNGRFKDIDFYDNVLTINIFDKEGNEIEHF